jgi:GAF domain-containing protein
MTAACAEVDSGHGGNGDDGNGDARAFLRGLQELGSALARGERPAELAREAAWGLRELGNAAICDIWLVEGRKVQLIASCHRCGCDTSAEGRSFQLSQMRVAERVVNTATSHLITGGEAAGLGAGERLDTGRRRFAALLAVPLATGERVFGGVCLYDEEAENLAAGTDRVTMAARLVGASYENAVLVERLERASRELGRANAELAHANGELETLNRHLAEAYREIGLANSELTRSNSDLRALVEASLDFGATLDVDEVLVASARRICRVAGAERADIMALVGDELRSLVCVQGEVIVSERACDTWPLAETGISRSVVESAEPVWVVDAGKDSQLSEWEREYFARHGQRSGMFLPLVSGGQVIGLVLLTDSRAREMYAQSLLRGLGQLAARALSNAMQHRESEMLNRIARSVMSTLSIAEIAEFCVVELSTLVPFECAALLLSSPTGTTAPFLWGLDELDERRDLDAWLQPGFNETLARERVLRLVLPQQCPVRPDHPWLADMRSLGVIAIESSGELAGALVLGSRRPSAFHWVNIGLFFRVGVQLSLALNNALLFERVRTMHRANLKTLSSALNAKDPYTLGHAVRVAAYLALLGHELGWTGESIARAQEVVYLHDIGKLAISDGVLLKSAELTGPEWGLMRRHSVFSAEIIDALFDPCLVGGVRHHHERWDGTGYPDGLGGEDIPEVARALAVADAYDAMSSTRPYRAALSYEECIRELQRCRGGQFEPRMVDAFLRVLSRMHERRAEARRAAEEAARRIDAATHERLWRPAGEQGREYEEVAAVLRSVRCEHPPAQLMYTARLDAEGVPRIVVDTAEDGAQISRRGEALPLTAEISEVVKGRKPRTNVVLVNRWGTWVSACALTRRADGEPAFLTFVDMPPSDGVDLEGLHADMTQALATLVNTAAGRLSADGGSAAALSLPES